jgi:hypothetical protein
MKSDFSPPEAKHEFRSQPSVQKPGKKLSLEQYPIEVLKAVLQILRSRDSEKKGGRFSTMEPPS